MEKPSDLYQVIVTKAADKELARLPVKIRDRIQDAIDDLAKAPRPSGVKKLKGEEDTYRIRVGDYRVIYQIHDKDVVILIVWIRHRKDAYE